MRFESFHRQFFIFSSRTPIIGIRINRYPSARGKEPRHLDIFRVHQLYKVLHYDVHAVLVEVAVITETEQVELKALALHHLYVWDVADSNLREIRLSGNRTKRSEFRAIEPNPIVISGMLVHEGLQYIRCIIVSVLGLASQSGKTLNGSINHY